VLLDLCSRRIVGWDYQESMTEALVLAALRQAICLQRPPLGNVVNDLVYTASFFRFSRSSAFRGRSWDLSELPCRDCGGSNVLSSGPCVGRNQWSPLETGRRVLFSAGGAH